MRARWLIALSMFIALNPAFSRADSPKEDGKPLPGTQPLTWTGDIPSRLVEGADQFLLKKIEGSVGGRAKFWNRDTSTVAKYTASVEPNRKRLAQIVGVRDPRVPSRAPELAGTTAEPSLIGQGVGYSIHAVRWGAFGDVHGEGLLLVPNEGKPSADIVAIPDSSQTPEQLVGLVEGVPLESQFARRLAESGCRVLVPMLIDRNATLEKHPNGSALRLTNREFLYRSAFELGRHLIGYEVQKVLAAVDWLSAEAGGDASVGVIGWGEGGLIALYAGALDPRIDAVGVSGYFEDRRNLWREPLDRNVFGLLEQFGDAELASLIAPRSLIVEAAKGPELVVPPGTGGGPGRVTTPKRDTVRKEVERAKGLVNGLTPAPRIELIVSGEGAGAYGTPEALQAFLASVNPAAKLAAPGALPKPLRASFDPLPRLLRQFHEIDRHNQWLLNESQYVRNTFMAKLDTSSLDKYEKTAEPYRTFFAEEVIGRCDDKPLPPNVRTRLVYDEPRYRGYEVVMDVFPDVIAYGILLLPKDIKEGEKRPVVICQHGLEGRPQDVADPRVESPYYHSFANRLAERGFITFAPQNLYIFNDRFRTLQRKGNSIKKTLFSIIVPQHQQITDWLKSLPTVDPARIAFYGLSYGGKSAMRIPPLVSNYCLSICSGDFNEWVLKNASTRAPFSYVWTPEYEIFEFDLGSTFNYAEMAALIAPRPFMVERGHFDGVGLDEYVAFEFAKVFHRYDAKLGIGDRCELEWFTGPHTIHGVGTYDFLHKHLKWPKP
jgi:dienelactone hydrolase